ncbi:PREDICTED: angio-associated migratory cell protein [Ceratosolen solmsi marchali]|uniref:Angio-associated migratory cell protein n=1 Tax=Ceratosolen solmsi marchali TaxID=326594 RepID=A0AAJ6YNZ4_9HYME|nr:PREDICTED: angio-associated migratory cell protein [Ceratosolen solmsi marchali]
MGNQETPPSSPYMEEYIEEIDDNDLDSMADGDIEIIESYQVEENEEEASDDMAEEEVIVEAMEREDASCIFEKHTASVFCGSLSKDAQYAVTGGEDDKAYVWDVKSGKLILECENHKDSVIFADFSYDDLYLATGDMNGIIQIRKTSDRTIIWNDDMGDATWMQWHSMAHVLLAGSVKGEIYMWKIPEGECKIIQGFGNRTETACLMPDGKRLVVGYEDGVIRVIDLKSCAILTTISSHIGHNAAITSLDCHMDNNLILSASVDKKTIVSAANTGKIISILQDLSSDSDDNIDESCSSDISKGNWIEAVSFYKDPVQHIAATGSVNGYIFIWDVSRKILRHKIDQGSGVAKLLWKENTFLIFSAGLDGILRCYDSRTGGCVHTFLGHTEDILDICISKDGKTILTTSDDTTARIFEINAV